MGANSFFMEPTLFVCCQINEMKLIFLHTQRIVRLMHNQCTNAIIKGILHAAVEWCVWFNKIQKRIIFRANILAWFWAHWIHAKIRREEKTVSRIHNRYNGWMKMHSHRLKRVPYFRCWSVAKKKQEENEEFRNLPSNTSLECVSTSTRRILSNYEPPRRFQCEWNIFIRFFSLSSKVRIHFGVQEKLSQWFVPAHTYTHSMCE